jgi:general secretion pathway protein N
MRRRIALSRSLLALALATVAIAAALVVMPARWLMLATPASWPLAVVDASGSIWRGTALVALGHAGARATLPDPLTWRLTWDKGPRVQVSHPWLGCQMTLRPGMSSLGLAPCSIRLPATTLAALGAPFNTLLPSGTLQARWPALRLPYRADSPTGELVTLEWTQAASALSRVQPLGHYRLALAGTADRTMSLTLSTLSGPLQMQGSGSLHPRNGLRFKGKAGPAPDASTQTVASLQALLSAIGRRTGNDTLLHFGQ